jgi:hypothetical protein
LVRIRPAGSFVLGIALAVLQAPRIFGQDGDSAKRFVESLYRPYADHGKGIDFSEAKGSRYFDAPLNALLEADAKAAGPDEVGVLDGDPICSCQDWDGVWDLKIVVQMLNEERAKAAVTFALFAPKAGDRRDLRSLEMALVREAGVWRIDNIVDHSDPKAPFDLRAELEKELQTLKQKTSRSGSKTPGNQ